MSTVHSILSGIVRPIPRIGPDATVLEAAKLMNQFKLGELVVCEDNACLGIFTERDLIRCFLEAPLTLSHQAVKDVMNCELLICRPETELIEARRIMVVGQIRGLPVINDKDQLVGLISLVDINAHDFKGQVIEADQLKNYIYGRH